MKGEGDGEVQTKKGSASREEGRIKELEQKE